jgi:dTDP-4-amino-4,6-dideoxygalactose transaminase
LSLSVVSFTRPYRSAREVENVASVLASGHVHGDGPFTQSATTKLKTITSAENVLLTTSGTHALDMASLLLGLGPGDEVIMPSFTFPSAANAVALTGARIVFLDIEPVTGNLDVSQLEKNVTPRTKAISVVHYGGVAGDMDEILRVSTEYGLPIIEDNAHGLGARWNDKQLGTLGVLGIQSFHDTKNIHSGEGGALLVNDPELLSRAEMIREKGTNRSRFLRGQVDKYTWTDIGSSYLLSELNAAVLDSQLDEFTAIQAWRHRVWNRYQVELAEWASARGVSLMSVPDGREHPAHLFYLLMKSHSEQSELIAHLKELAIIAAFHYVPLDTSVAGRKYGSAPEPCDVSADFSERLVRLPLWAGMTDDEVARVIDGVRTFHAR